MLLEELSVIATLIRGQRQAALGSLADGAPFVSLVAFVVEPDFGGFLLHLSELAPHTKQLRADERASLLISEPERPEIDDVQTLARITLLGSATPLPKDTAAYRLAREHYLTHLPAAAMLFGFGDFQLWRFVPREARYVGGFARAYTLTAEHLRRAALARVLA